MATQACKKSAASLSFLVDSWNAFVAADMFLITSVSVGRMNVQRIAPDNSLIDLDWLMTIASNSLKTAFIVFSSSGAFFFLRAGLALDFGLASGTSSSESLLTSLNHSSSASRAASKCIP
eukprot:TRINITY_DN65473_c0_g1_i1.p4 TRINITY_DN65473_c0_g1~~TRINITY_DN65473_c0_g1_i1.p4  ORF type:complete len:120 (-),score=16.53 TRINITY_DN65473_c0_g1_i1:221-580(-)